MNLKPKYIRRYLILLAALLSVFSLFALFASKYLVTDERYLVVFSRSCAFFGTPLVLFTLIKIFADESDEKSGKTQHNLCLFLASLTLVIFGFLL